MTAHGGGNVARDEGAQGIEPYRGKEVMDLTACADDIEETDSEDSQNTIVFRASRAMVSKVKEERQ